MENKAFELKLELMERIEQISIIENIEIRHAIREAYDIYLDYSEYHAKNILGIFASICNGYRDVFNLIREIADIRGLNEILPETLNLLELAAVR